MSEQQAVLSAKGVSSPQGLSPSDLNSIIKEVSGKPIVTPMTKVIEACNQSTDSPAKKKSIAETKKLIDSFKENVSNYPKHLSYEGSVVLCSLIGLKQNNDFRLEGLPKSDIELIHSQFPSPETVSVKSFEYSVELDDQQDFKLKCEDFSTEPPRVINLRFFNSVIRPNTNPSDIPIEQDGNTVKVGNNLVLDQHRIQKLVGNAPPEKSKTEDDFPRRQLVSGRNAYEIRADILSLSVDFMLHNNKYGKEKSGDEVIALAKKFYSFVENKR